MQSAVSTVVPSIQAPTIQPPSIQPPTIQGPAIQTQTIQPDESWLQYWPVAAIVVGALILLAGLYLLFLIWKARRQKAALESAERRAAGEAAQLDRNRRAADKNISKRLRKSFNEATAALKAGTSGRNYRYQVPWFLMVGENDSGKSTLLDNAGMPMPLGRIGRQTEVKNVCDWYFYADGLMINVNGGAFLQSDGAAVGGRIWKNILRQLARRRPERPIDGIVLTIPADDLLSPLDESRERIRAKADAMYQRLVEAQKGLGLCFPVYVVITKCDHITGFREFSAAIPNRFGDQIFGWSSPYTLETAFNARWVDEAIAGMDAHIYEMQSEVFSESEHIAGRDDLFLFPAEFQKITEPLKEFMSGIFKQSVYHETIFLRGMYFTGSGIDAPPEQRHTAADMEAATDEEVINAIEETTERSAVDLQAKPFFVRELFEKKIFPEWQIARPASRLALHQNRTIRAIQIGLVCMTLAWAAGLWWSYDNLVEKSRILLPFLEALRATDADNVTYSRTMPNGAQVIDTAKMVREFRRNQGNADWKSGVAFNPFVVNQFVNYANSPDAAEIWSLWNPASWPVFTRLHSDITECMRLKYRDFILEVFRTKLASTAAEITAEKEAAAAGSGGSDVRPEQMQEYENLIGYSAKLDRLGRMIDNYNELSSGGEGDLDKVSALMEYLFNIRPTQSFQNSSADYFTTAVNKAKGERITPADYSQAATRKFEKLMNALTWRMLHQNPINRSLDEVQGNMTKLVQFDPASSNDVSAYGGLVDKLNTSIDMLQRNLDRTEFAWTFSSETPRPITSVFAAMKNSTLVNPDEITRIEQKFIDEFGVFRNSITSRRADYFTTPFLAQKDSSRYAMSDEILNVKKALAALLSKDFMRTEGFGGSELLSERIQWDPDALNESSRLLSENIQFVTQTIPKLENISEDLKQSLANVARFQIELDARKRIRGAQKSYPSQTSEERTTKEEIKDLNSKQNAISTLLRSLRSGGMDRAGGELSGSVVRQMSKLLKDSWRYMDSLGRYNFAAADLSAWEGTQDLSQALFRADNKEEFADQIKQWRNDVTEDVVTGVLPMITFLQSPAVNTDLPPEGRQFQLVAEQLEKYEKKIPGNSVLKVEEFLLQKLDSIKYNTNYERYTKAPRDISGRDDYFTRNLRNMQNNILRKCEALVEIKAFGIYKDARVFFNQRLAGHFPFVADPAQYVTMADEARPDDLREFYAEFGPHLAFVQRWLELRAKNTYHERTVESAKNFVVRMIELQKALNGFLTSDRPDAVPAFDATFEYRQNPLKDKSGDDKIVEWKVQSGDNETNNNRPGERIRWEWGKPMKITLRWAKDGAVKPLPPDTADGIHRVEDKSAVYEFGYKWSLLQMMKNKEQEVENDDRREADSRDVAVNWYLKLDTKTNEQSKPEAKTYLRLRLYAPGEKDPVYTNGFIKFPYKADKLETK